MAGGTPRRKPRRVLSAGKKIPLKKPAKKRGKVGNVIKFSETGFYFDGKVYRNRKTGAEVSFELTPEGREPLGFSDVLNLREGRKIVAKCSIVAITMVGSEALHSRVSSVKELKGRDVRPAFIKSNVAKGAGVFPVVLHYFKSLGARGVFADVFKYQKLWNYYQKDMGFKLVKDMGKHAWLYLDLNKAMFK